MLSGLQFGVQARELRECGSRHHVVLFKHGADRALALQDTADKQNPRAQEVADFSCTLADHVRLGNQLHAKELGHRRRIHGVGLVLRVTDRLEILRVRQAQVNPLRDQEIAHPVPHAGAFADGLVRTLKGREVRGNGAAVRREVRLPHDAAGGINGVDREGPLVEIDARVEHVEGLTEQGGTRSISRPDLVGNIIALVVTGPPKIAADSLR
jgi:hypothetical protein